MCTVFDWKISLYVPPKMLPLKRALLRQLGKESIPCVDWGRVRGILIALRGSNTLAMLHTLLRRSVCSLGRRDSYQEVLLQAELDTEDPPRGPASQFPHLYRLYIDLPMLSFLRTSLPMITRLKVLVARFAATNENLGLRLRTLFPNLTHLSLQVGLDALPGLSSLPDFTTPPNFTLGVVQLDATTGAPLPGRPRRAALIMAAHLFPLPVSWGLFFKNVIRLQMSELANHFQ